MQRVRLQHLPVFCAFHALPGRILCMSSFTAAPLPTSALTASYKLLRPPSSLGLCSTASLGGVAVRLLHMLEPLERDERRASCQRRWACTAAGMPRLSCVSFQFILTNWRMLNCQVLGYGRTETHDYRRTVPIAKQAKFILTNWRMLNCQVLGYGRTETHDYRRTVAIAKRAKSHRQQTDTDAKFAPQTAAASSP